MHERELPEHPKIEERLKKELGLGLEKEQVAEIPSGFATRTARKRAWAQPPVEDVTTSPRRQNHPLPPRRTTEHPRLGTGETSRG